MADAEIIYNLTNHPPVDAEDFAWRVETLRAHAKRLGVAINDLTPACREQSLAFTNLEQSVMWAVAAIARHQ